MARRRILVTTTVAIVNESTVVTDAEATTVAKALHRQVSSDFAPHWGIRANVYHYIHKPPPTAWVLVILDDSDMADALGYHDVTPAGLPVGKVFARTDMDYWLSWSVTASHELLEMLGDPSCVIASQIADTTFVAQENCDPVEADRYGYTINGVAVSDFVLPTWFQPGTPGPYDFTGHLTRPLTLLPGGYASVWTPQSGWTQHTARGLPGITSRAARARRINRRLWGNEPRASTAERLQPDDTIAVA
jgi:hypothetical protein